MTSRGSKLGAEKARRRIASLLGHSEHWDRSARRIIGITSSIFAEHLGRVIDETQADSLTSKTLWMHMLRGSCSLLGVRAVAKIAAEGCLRGMSTTTPVGLTYGMIGCAVQRACLCSIAKEQDPEWYKKHERLIRRSTMQVVDRELRAWTSLSGNLLGVRQWSSRERMALSVFLVDEYSRVSGACGVIGKDLVATPAAVEWLEELRDADIENSFLSVPLESKPLRWPQDGMVGAPVNISHPMVRQSSGASPGVPLDLKLPEVELGLNRLQETPLRVNKPLLAVFESFIAHPASPAFDFDSTGKGRSLAISALATARKYADAEELYFAYHADYRGRVYPAESSGLHWQGSHRVKALLEFAHPQPIPQSFAGRFKQIGATLAGQKGTHKELELWTDRHTDMVKWIARDPHSNREWMLGGRDSFLFLAWCMDYASWLADPSHKSRLIASRDATQSGFQICALLARDEDAAKLVNAFPIARPSDLYTIVLDALGDAIPSARTVVQRKIHLLGLDRSKIKSLVIPISSSSSSPAVSSLVRKMFTYDQYQEHGHKALNLTARWVAHTVRDILGDVTPGAMRYLTWASDMGRAAIEGRAGLSWTSPSGLPVHQYSYLKSKVKHAGRATPSNFVQSIDAALLLAVVNGVGSHIAVAHDCYGVHVASLERLETAIGKAYTGVFSEDLLLKLHTELASRMDDPSLLPEPFELGSLDTSLFARSKYAFS